MGLLRRTREDWRQERGYGTQTNAKDAGRRAAAYGIAMMLGEVKSPRQLEEEALAKDMEDLRRSYADMPVESKRAMLAAMPPWMLEDMHREGVLTDGDIALLLNAPADTDIGHYRTQLAARFASYASMGPSALIEEVESGTFQFMMEDAGVLGVVPQAALLELVPKIAVLYKKAKSMPPEVREQVDRLAP